MENLDNQFVYWDSVAHRKEFTHPLDMDRLQSLLSEGSTVLDVGCGYGRTCNSLHDLGFKTCGVDSSEEMISRGRKKYPHLNLKKSDGKILPFKKESFDAVILFAVLTCIPSDSGQMNLIAEIERILRPGGVLYVSDYWIQSDERNTSRYDKFFTKHGVYGIFELEEGTVLRHHENKWIDRLFERFLKVELLNLNVKTMNGNPAKAFQYFGKRSSHL